MIKRIVTRPDFDGVVCATLIREALDFEGPILWVEPGDMQQGRVEIQAGDAIANLPYDERCSLWFDHHVTNVPKQDFNGAFELAPSAAGIVYRYYPQLSGRYDELIFETDKIDSAGFTEAEVRRPEDNLYILLSMTIQGRNPEDEPYWNEIVDRLRSETIAEITSREHIRQRCNDVIEQNKKYAEILRNSTTVHHSVAVSDFRAYVPPPKGNRFLVYAEYPETNVQMRVMNHHSEAGKIIISVGHSVFNRTCHVNIGYLLREHNGGGHRGAGSCNFPESEFETHFNAILAALIANEPNE